MAPTTAAPPPFDLQSHSLRSDGTLSPAEVVRRAATAGIELLSLTDHDSVAGVAEAQQAGQRLGVGVVPGVEISVVEPGRGDLHLLGYGIDPMRPALQANLARSREDRVRRAQTMAARLRALGFRLADERLQARRAAGEAIGRPHLADAVVAHPANRTRLRREGIADASGLLGSYLVAGRPGFVPRRAPSLAEAVGWIRDAGGLAIWAHPFWDFGDELGRDELGVVRQMLTQAAHMGLAGVEAFYVTHSERQVRALAQLSEELDLLTTGSSDFHGPDHPRFSRFGSFATYGLEPRLGAIARMGEPAAS